MPPAILGTLKAVVELHAPSDPSALMGAYRTVLTAAEFVSSANNVQKTVSYNQHMIADNSATMGVFPRK